MMLLTLLALALAPMHDCTESDQDAWLTPLSTSAARVVNVHSQRVVSVDDAHVAIAIAQVSRLPFVPLTAAEAASLTGRDDNPDGILAAAITGAPESAANDGFASADEAVEQAQALRGRLSPWLVRAVFPTPGSIAGAQWFGDTLLVAAGGMGCAPFARHPVVIWLEKMPHRIEVSAMAIR